LPITIAWTPAYQLGLSKAYELLLLVPLLCCVFIHPKPNQVALAFLRSLLVLLVVIGALALVQQHGSGRLTVLGGGPIVFGRNMGLLVIILVARGLQGGSLANKAVGALAITGALFAALLVLLSGSRGALFSVGVGLGYLFVRAKIWRLLLGLIVLAFAVVAIEDSSVLRSAQRTFTNRIVILTLRKRHLSGRGDLYRRSLAEFKSHWVSGFGLAGSQSRLDGHYPHNIVLEVACESGSVGLIFLFGFLFAVGLAFRGPRSPPAIGGIFLLLTTSAQFSGDLFDSRGVFIAGALLVAAWAPVGLQSSTSRRASRHRGRLLDRDGTSTSLATAEAKTK
jgi:O-antigen ligase